MNKVDFEDLKQFILSAISQSEVQLENRLIKRMDDGFAGVADAIENLYVIIDKNQTKTNRRLIRLENRLA